ncbi:unnamed protein product [Soboliphyme baturini]|uniref:Jacalin-type lectin domain-containing protein n=1 Tax=Soboliphyme baturini TaxID=241478 RepID=A0A183IXT4_9BILA|nr:unnamed protein product [Soboliphyme baturini]
MSEPGKQYFTFNAQDSREVCAFEAISWVCEPASVITIMIRNQIYGMYGSHYGHEITVGRRWADGALVDVLTAQKFRSSSSPVALKEEAAVERCVASLGGQQLGRSKGINMCATKRGKETRVPLCSQGFLRG